MSALSVCGLSLLPSSFLCAGSSSAASASSASSASSSSPTSVEETKTFDADLLYSLLSEGESLTSYAFSFKHTQGEKVVEASIKEEDGVYEWNGDRLDGNGKTHVYFSALPSSDLKKLGGVGIGLMTEYEIYYPAVAGEEVFLKTYATAG